MSNADGPAAVVREFYEAVRTGDVDAVRSLVSEGFAENATFTWPDSLPYGGTVSGRSKLQRVLGAAATGVGVRNLRLVDVIDGGDRVAAQLKFDWVAPNGEGAVSGTGAVEIWTFTDEQVSAIRAYYWDTAACAALSARMAGTSS